MPKFHNMGEEKASILIDTALGFILQGARPSCEESLNRCQEITGYDDIVFRTVFTSAVTTLRAAVRLRKKTVDLEKDLTSLNFPPSAVEKICTTVKMNRLELETAVRRSTVAFPTLVNTRWRVDITICSSALARVMKPSVLVEFTLSTGEIKTLEIPQDEFERLRFAVAQVLALMKGYENHPMMRLIADLERGKLKDKGYKKK